MDLIDFTSLPTREKAYTGANGSKIPVVYNGELYMLKFPAAAKKNPEMSYANSCFSEYLGCHIYESVGIPVQKTLLGTYTSDKGEKLVVACKDFTRPGIVLQDFAARKNRIVDSDRHGYGTELAGILYTINEQTSIDSSLLLERFWDMFIVDALIGNWDRHNGNWGFLYDVVQDTIELAPVYDCGSSLYPQADESIMQKVLSNKRELEYRVYEIPNSAIAENGKRIKYFEFISSLRNEGCNQALRRIAPRISMEKINDIIDATPLLSDLQREFYKTILQERKSRILDFSLSKLESENTQS